MPSWNAQGQLYLYILNSRNAYYYSGWNLSLPESIKVKICETIVLPVKLGFSP
jgi:hypothetical protein